MTESRHSAVTEPPAGALALIVPVMKARVPVEVQLEFPLPETEEPILEPFAGNLLVSYAVERRQRDDALGARQRRHEYVARRHCAEIGLAPEGLRDLAVANLRTHRPDLAFNWYPDVRAVAVTAGGDLESGLILDEGFVEKLAQDVDGDLVVAVPARDMFVASGTGHPDGVDKLRWVVDQIWSDDRHAGADAGAGEPDGPAGDRPHLLLTRDLLVRRGSTWEVVP